MLPLAVALIQERPDKLPSMEMGVPGDGLGSRVAIALAPRSQQGVRLDENRAVILDLEESAAARAMHALAGLGLRSRAPVDPADFADSRIREGWLQDKGMQVCGERSR